MEERNYFVGGQHSFGEAIEALLAGFRVARRGWNGKGMFLFLVPGSTFGANRPPLYGIYPEGTEVNYQPHIDMKTADGSIVPWLASQSDILAEDWELVGTVDEYTSQVEVMLDDVPLDYDMRRLRIIGAAEQEIGNRDLDDDC